MLTIMRSFSKRITNLLAGHYNRKDEIKLKKPYNAWTPPLPTAATQ
jgi:hypothetical protein